MICENVMHALDRVGISNTSYLRAIQDCGTLVRDGEYPEKVCEQIIGVKPAFKDHTVGMVTVQAMVEHIVKNRLDKIDTDEVLRIANVRAERVIAAHPEWYTSSPVQERKKDTEVIIKDNGEIKKGGKQLLAKQVYKQWLVDGNGSNKELVKRLIERCDLSKAGANTYSYNLRKQLPGWEIE